MKHFLKLICLVAVFAASLFTSHSAFAVERGEKSFGPRVGYVSRTSAVMAGLEFQYCFSRHVRLSPSVDIFFRNKDKDALAVNVNVDFPIAMSAKWNFYPVIGAGFTSWGHHSKGAGDSEGTKDVTTHTNAFGLNAGAGFEFYAMPSLKLSLEGNYKLMRHYPTATVLAGISYVF